MASFTERYHELTKYNPHTIDKLGAVRWDRQPAPFKDVRSQDAVDLTARLRFAEEAGGPETVAGLDRIARLLYLTLGITARIPGAEGHDFFLRAAPSAGGLYPAEIYLAVRNQPDLPDGIYHYHSLKSVLIPVWQGSFWADLQHYFLGQPALAAADLLFLFTGIYGRSAWRYKERAYRRILLDTGHALGNLLEACRAHGLEHALLGGFLDAGLEELLFLTPKEEFPLLGVAVAAPGALPAADKNQGQFPSAAPAEAIRHVEAADPMQVQQNACERIRSPEGLRDPVVGDCAGPSALPDPPPSLDAILLRRSCRKFDGGAISLERVRDILAFAFHGGGPPRCLAPGRLDFHLVALNVVGLEPGVYDVEPADLGLRLRRPGEFKSEAYHACLGQELAADCSFLIVHTANLAALAGTYGDRGYRYVCMDAGQIGERLNLRAVGLGLGSSGIGGYYDDEANALLALPLFHAIIYITVLGVPQE